MNIRTLIVLSLAAGLISVVLHTVVVLRDKVEATVVTHTQQLNNL